MGSLSRLLETPVLRRLRPRPVGMPSEHSTEGRCAFSRKPRPPPPPPSWTAPVRQTVAWGPVAFSRSARSPPPPAVTRGHALGRLTRRHAPGRLTRGSLRVFAKTTPTATVFTVTAAPESAVRPRRCRRDPSRPRLAAPGRSPATDRCTWRVFGAFDRGHALGRSTRGSLRDFAKITSPRPAPVLPRGGTPARSEASGRCLPQREGRCAISQKSRPPDLRPSFPGAAHPPGASPAAGACPGGRVVARFRKKTRPPTCARPSPGRHTRPERHQRQEPASAGVACPAGGRGRCAISQKTRPPRPVPVFPASWPGLGRTRREGRCAILQKPRPPRLVLILPRGRGPARAGPGGRVVAQFRKKTRPRPPTGPFPSRPAPKPAARRRWTVPQPTRNSAGAGTPREAPCCPSVRRQRAGRSGTENRKQRKRNAPQRRRVGTSPRSARIIGVHRRSSAARILACLGKPPHRRQQRFAPPAHSCQGAQPRRRRDRSPRPSLLPSRGSSARRRRQHLQRRHRPGIRIAKELPPLRLGHVLPPRVLPRRPLIGHPGPRIITLFVLVDPPRPRLHRQWQARLPPRAATARSPRSSPRRRSRRSSG